MTGVGKLTGATSCLGSHWKTIEWKKVKAEVKRLQVRIAKAVREGKRNKAKSLQWVLSHSFSAKLLAVKIGLWGRSLLIKLIRNVGVTASAIFNILQR